MEIAHIGLDVPENFPDVVIDKITTDIQSSGLKVKVNKHKTSVMAAALDWVLPTAIAAYVFKPYFESFLQEAGKDHYKMLKSWLKKFANDGRAIKVYRITASQSTQKNIDNDDQSRSVSILLQTKNGKIIKLLFNDSMTQEDWNNAIEQLLDFALEHYEKFPNDRLSSVLEELETERSAWVYAIIDKTSKQLQFYNDSDLIKLHREQSEK